MNIPEVERFAQLPSTNSYLKDNRQGRGQFAVVTADYQTAGRGQRGNGWESAPGQNLLMSMLFLPPEGFAAARQFEVSIAVALAVADCVAQFVPAEMVAVKWPNDIYISDGKVAGILIENALGAGGCISHTVIGIGLNVNQRRFLSGAPNPVSLAMFREPEPVGEPAGISQLNGCEYVGDSEFDIASVRDCLIAQLKRRLSAIDAPGYDSHSVLSEYNSRLWHRRGIHRWRSLIPSAAPAPTAILSAARRSDPLSFDASSEFTATGSDASTEFHTSSEFDASIVGVELSGTIALRRSDSTILHFNFKELAPVI